MINWTKKYKRYLKTGSTRNQSRKAMRSRLQRKMKPLKAVYANDEF
jgi:hypothetical protein